MEKVCLLGQMEIHLMDNGLIIKKKDMVYIFVKMAMNLLVDGKMIKSMVKVYIK